jgi:hypothetical protein
VQLTGILGVLRANIIVASVQDIFVHERGPGSDLSEERNLDWLADLDTLALLHKDLPSVLAPILTIQGGHTVLFWVVTLLERLKGGHEIMSTGDTMRYNPFGDTGRNGTLDDGGD